MASVYPKIKDGKIVSFKFKAFLGRDENGKQIFRCKTWYPPAELTKAKSKREAARVAILWEKEIKEALEKALNDLGETTYHTVITFDLLAFNS